MALIKADFFSMALMRTVSIQVILPVDKKGMAVRAEKPYKTLYLLHGIFGNDTDWISETCIARLAMERNLAVVMPSGENKFYLDHPDTLEYFSRFIGEELIEITRDMFPLSNQREDTFIAGLSMGGYGALINGLKYHETFSVIGAFSPALMLDTLETKAIRHGPYLINQEYLESIFGPLDQVRGSDKDYMQQAKDLKDNRPCIFLSCGLDDSLLNPVRQYCDFLLKEGYEVIYDERKGGHEWDVWDEEIRRFLKELPLDQASRGLGSGHIQ